MIEIIICSILLLVFIYMLRREFLSPTFAVALCFLVAASFCLIYKEEWAINLQSKTVDIILIGLISCFFGEITAATLEQRKERNFLNSIEGFNEAQEFYIDRYKIVLFILIFIIRFCLIVFSFRIFKGGLFFFNNFDDAAFLCI